MPEPRQLKKSETLEVRIPYPTKQAFMARCRDEGVSASEAVRSFIDGRLEARPARRSRTALRLAVGAVIAAAVGAVALPSLARPSALSELERLNAAGPVRDSQVRRVFEQLDANGDGVISLDEFRRGGSALRAR